MTRSAQVHYFENLALVFVRQHSTVPHAHRALQMAVALDQPFAAALDRDSARDARPMEFLCVAPDRWHYLAPCEGWVAQLYFDIAPRGFAQWRERGGEVRSPSARLIEELREARCSNCRDRDALAAIAGRWLIECLPGLRREPPSHPRVAAALALVDDAEADPGNYAKLARRVHLSPSRFAHLFREFAGCTVREYLLWRRLLRALTRLESGHSITDAAHDAGFADGAHLCRSFRRVFGAMPSHVAVIARP